MAQRYKMLLSKHYIFRHLVSQIVSVLRRGSSDKDGVVFSQLTSGRTQEMVRFTEDFNTLRDVVLDQRYGPVNLY